MVKELEQQVMSLGNRMKAYYEDRYRIRLTRWIPVIIRLDGKTFHTLTKDCEKPFDQHFSDCMVIAAERVASEVQGAKCAYVASDEISILVTDFDRPTTEAWFDYNLQKMVSIAASIAAVTFTNWFFQGNVEGNQEAFFDGRAFNMPKEEVSNYFIWRQKDWMRDSVYMFARAHFSHEECMYKRLKDLHEMLHKKGLNWASLPPQWKNGTFLKREEFGWTSMHTVIFAENLEIIEDLWRVQKETRC